MPNNTVALSTVDAFFRAIESVDARRIAAHWTMTARAADDTEVRAEGIDIITMSVDGLIERVDGYWDARSFVAALSRTGER